MRITPLIASRFMSDGGTMFGPVPKTIWSKMIQPDESNRIHQNAHALLVELDDGRKGLVESGCGAANLFSDKEIALHGLSKGWPLEQALTEHRVSFDDISFVIPTHLHWDHAGGLSRNAGAGKMELSFPHAQHFIHAFEWEDATSGNPLFYKAYPSRITESLRSHMKTNVSLFDSDEIEVASGLRVVRSGGHTRGHCVVLFEGSNIQLNLPSRPDSIQADFMVFAGDVCSMVHHLRLVFQTAYDMYPLDTRAWRRQWFPVLEKQGGLLLFDHDPEHIGATIQRNDRGEFESLHRIETC